MADPFPCTNTEKLGYTEMFDFDGNLQTTLVASKCFANWYMTVKPGWTWRWKDGINPDDPTTWPSDYVPIN